MVIKDIYVLKESDSIELMENQEATINLELAKVPPCLQTLLVGKILYRCLPIRNATVMVLGNDGSPPYITETDENGIYRFHNILAPGKYNVIVSANGYNTSLTKTVFVSDYKITRLSFHMNKSSIYFNGIVCGKILETECGKPINDALIYLNCVGNGNQTFYQTRSNINGLYLICDILPNYYDLVIEKQGYMVNEPIRLIIEQFGRVNYTHFLYQ